MPANIRAAYNFVLSAHTKNSQKIQGAFLKSQYNFFYLKVTLHCETGSNTKSDDRIATQFRFRKMEKHAHRYKFYEETQVINAE